MKTCHLEPKGQAVRSTRRSFSLRRRCKVDGLCEKRLGAALKRFTFRVCITIRRNHDYRNVGAQLPWPLATAPRPLIPGMLMSDRMKMSDRRAASRNTLQRHGSGLRKFHGEAVSAEIPPELLTEKHLHVRLIVHDENEQVHGVLPFLSRQRRTRQHDPNLGDTHQAA